MEENIEDKEPTDMEKAILEGILYEYELERTRPKVSKKEERKTLAETLGITPEEKEKKEFLDTGEARMKKRKVSDVGEPKK